MRLKAQDCLFVQIDVQEKLFPYIANFKELEKNLLTLVKGLQLHNIPIIVNEQYKKGLGETIPSLRKIVNNYPHYEKTTFSCCGQKEGLAAIKATRKKFIILAGIETHVCVLQTALDLLEDCLQVVLVTDCINSRKAKDNDMAIKRLIQMGAIVTTYESLLFELTTDAKNAMFKEISKLVK